MAFIFDTSPNNKKTILRLKKFLPPTVSVSASPSTLSLPLHQSIVTAARYQSTQGQIPHHHWWCLPLWHSPRPTLSLSHLGFSVFSFSQAQPWPSFCFHSHLSPLAVPLIGVTTTGGRGSSSLMLYFLSLLFFFSIFICLLDKTETPWTLVLFHFFLLVWWITFCFSFD